MIICSFCKSVYQSGRALYDACHSPVVKKTRYVFSHLDKQSSAALVAACAMPFLMPHKVRRVYVSLLCVALVVSIIRPIWNSAEDDEKMVEQNKEFERIHGEMRNVAERLNASLRIWLKLPEQVEEYGEKSKDFTNQLLERLKILSDVCQAAIPDQALQDRLNTVQNANAELTRLTSECARRGEELKSVNQELQAVVSQLAQQVEQGTRSVEEEKQLLQRLRDLISSIEKNRVSQ